VGFLAATFAKPEHRLPGHVLLLSLPLCEMSFTDKSTVLPVVLVFIPSFGVSRKRPLFTTKKPVPLLNFRDEL
jgi:hypothetical protein